MQRLQHGCSLLHAVGPDPKCSVSLLLWLPAHQHMILLLCKGSCWAWSGSVWDLLLNLWRYSPSAVSRVLVTGLEAEVWTCIKNKQLNRKHGGHLGHADMSRGIIH